MKFSKSTLLLMLCTSLVAACGLRGPLYLPEAENSVDNSDQNSDRAAMQQSDNNEKQKEKEDDGDS